MRGRACVAFRTVCVLALLHECIDPALPSAQDQPRPTFHTEANYVRVEAYPTRDGARITDLRREDFDVLEDKVPQTIDQFEHIAIPTITPQDAGTVAKTPPASAASRGRVFVLFLDIKHVDGDASRSTSKRLADALDRLVGPDDLIAVMRPDMSARDVTFTRREATVAGLLQRFWWTESDRTTAPDKVEERYASCYPGVARPGQATASDQGIAQEMILRRREKLTLDALEDLVTFLRGVRAERKAVLTISDGWRLFGRSGGLERPIDGVVPLGAGGAAPQPARAPVTASDPQDRGIRGRADCEFDRVELAELDDQRRLQTIADQANRSNASFYPIDPRAVGVLEGPAASAGVGNASLRTLAEATDGLAIGTSALESRLRRISEDLSDYYLLGYYSTGKSDGKFHATDVRVKRPGVKLRTRRGFLAAAAGGAPEAGAGSVTTRAPDLRALADAVGSLSAFAREIPLRLGVAIGWSPAGMAIVRTVAEASTGASSDEWTGGGQADALLIDASGATVTTAQASIDPGASSVELRLASPALVPGPYELRVRTKGAGGSTPMNESVSIVVPAAPGASGAVFFRRGPTTGNKSVPTADQRFRRSDRLRIDMPTLSGAAVSAKLLDKTGKALPIPVASSLRDDPDGTRWRAADVSLVPLAPGDYLIELTAGNDRTLTAFRVVP